VHFRKHKYTFGSQHYEQCSHDHSISSQLFTRLYARTHAHAQTHKHPHTHTYAHTHRVAGFKRAHAVGICRACFLHDLGGSSGSISSRSYLLLQLRLRTCILQHVCVYVLEHALLHPRAHVAMCRCESRHLYMTSQAASASMRISYTHATTCILYSTHQHKDKHTSASERARACSF
jgi:hypothetical protein